MSRRVLAVLFSSVCLWTSIPASASAATEAAKPAQAAEAAARTANRPPLPPGRALDIRTAQGEGFDDLGPGVIIASVAGATALLFLMMFSDDDDDGSSPPTGTN
jgi:hypothetical protein